MQRFLVTPSSPRDEIFGSLPAFDVRDELYLHEYDPSNRIHFYVEFEGEPAPIVWTRAYDQGRIAYCALGHTGSTMHHPAVQAIVQRGLAWVCRRQT